MGFLASDRTISEVGILFTDKFLSPNCDKPDLVVIGDLRFA
jgi:hypothetical protein